MCARIWSWADTWVRPYTGKLNDPRGDPGGNWDELGFETNKTRYQIKGEVGDTGNIASSFLLTAQSDLDSDGEPYDTWTLDNNGAITHADHYK